MALLKRLIAEGKINPVIDRTYPFSELREAISYLETGTPKAKLSSPIPDASPKARGERLAARTGQTASSTWVPSGQSDLSRLRRHTRQREAVTRLRIFHHRVCRMG